MDSWVLFNENKNNNYYNNGFISIRYYIYPKKILYKVSTEFIITKEKQSFFLKNMNNNV